MTRKAEKTHKDTKLALHAPIAQAPVLPGPPPPGSAIEPAMPPPVSKRKQQKKKWTPSALPKNSKVRDTVSAILAMKVQGFSKQEIAEYLKLKPASISQYLWIAGKNGWLDTRDPHEIMHSEMVHKVVDNYKEWLHARDARTNLPDKEVTMESVKLFFGNKDGNAQQSDAAMTNVLAIQITMPQPGAPLPQMREGNDGGSPAYVDGQILTTEPGRRLPE